MTNYQTFINNILVEASNIATTHFGQVSSTVKADDPNQVLTEADLKIGKFLVDQVKQVYPSFNVIDEEAGVIDKNSNFTWVIDPIDGTSNFAQGLPHYGVMIGLLDQGEPIAGGVVLPAFSEIYVAEKGQGVWLNGKQITVVYDKKLVDSLISYGIDGHPNQKEKTHQEMRLLEGLVLSTRNIRSSNSAYDFMMVVAGKYGAYLNKSSKIWDNVAPQVMIEEMGGKYTDFSGERLSYDQPLTRASENFEYCAAISEQVHQEIMKICQQEEKSYDE